MSDGLVFSVDDVCQELSNVTNGRTAAQERVTVEMLHLLSGHHLETLAIAFSHRSGQPLDEHDLSIPGWHCLVGFLIPKRHP
eukprot:6803384-Heterocapsa_arctica.AAC.1